MREMALMFGGFIAIIGVMFGALGYENHQKTEQMKACVTSGDEWVRDMGSYYECLKEK